jgi:hypothetical protein
VADTSAPAPVKLSRRSIGGDLAALGGLTLLLRLPAFFASAHLTFDDGVFGSSAVAMRNGGVPFRDVFSSQGPAFLPLVWLGDLLGLRTMNGPRVLGVLSGLALVALVYLAALEISDRTRARLVATLVAVSGSVLGVTASLAADGPAMVFATAAILFALRYRRSPDVRTALAIGFCIGVAIMVKALVLPVALPIGLVLLARRRWAEAALAVGAAVVTGLLLSLAFGFADVWDQSVVYHLDAPGSSSWADNARKLVSTFFTRDIVLVAGAVVAALAAVLRSRQSSGVDSSGAIADDGLRPAVPVLLWLWLAGMTVLLIGEHPLWRPHVSELTPPIALLIAWYRPPWKAVVVVAALTIPLHLTYALDLLDPDDYEGDDAALVAELEDLPSGAVAISDDPGFVWRAGLQAPPALVDASVLLVDSGRLTTDDITDAARAPDVCAVVVWTSRFGGMADLPDELIDAGYVVARTFSTDNDIPDSRVLNDTDRYDQALYVRPDCRP